MAYFEFVDKYKDAGLDLPTRKTGKSAGYDLVAAADCVIPSIWNQMKEANSVFTINEDEYITTTEMMDFTKATGIKPTLVTTGVKCMMSDDEFLQLSVRSSTPLKTWLMLANGVGIIDADYYGNPSNDGEIFLQMYNLSPFNIMIHKGEAIGQAIILPYHKVENDSSCGERVGGFGSTNG